MPIEIREINIKTDIVSRENRKGSSLKEQDFNSLKAQLLIECKRIIALNNKKTGRKR
jgi:Family of unknown function (DUF5908)